MGDTKGKKDRLTWIIIALGFTAVIFVLLNSLYSNSRKAVTKYVQDKFTGNASLVAAELRNEIASFEKKGENIKEYVNANELKYTDSEAINFIGLIQKDSNFYRILVCTQDGEKIAALDDSGKEHDVSGYAEFYAGSDLSVNGYYFFDNDLMGSGNTIVCRYPIDEVTSLLFMFDVDSFAKAMSSLDIAGRSFGVIFKKDGTILKKLNNFADNNSQFISRDSLIDTIKKGADSEDFNYFRSSLYNGTSCSVKSQCNGEVRTICCASIGIEDWYFAVGVRQYEVDNLHKDSFKDIKKTTVELGIVIVIFVVLGVLFIAFNFSKSKEKGKVLADKADMDLLTELTNKVATERNIAEYMADNPDGHGVLFILDIDNFKKVNDTMGHAFGDTLLKTLGKQIRTEFRISDIVGRTGGDEFMIFLKGISDELIVEREANRLTRFFHDFKAGGDYVKYSATASIGAAVFPEDGASFKELYVSADQALYRAKKRGKNQLVFYNEEKYGK